MKIRTILSSLLTALTAIVFAVSAGLPILDVTPDGAAKKAGVQAGDVLISVDEAMLGDFADLERTLAEHSPGDRVRVVVQRDGTEQQLSVQLGGAPGGRATVGVMINTHGNSDPSVDTKRPIDATERAKVLQSISTQMREGYIYEEKGNKLARSIAEAAGTDRFSEHDELGSFVAGVNLFLLEISEDRHLSLRFGSEDGTGAGARRVVRRVPSGSTEGAPTGEPLQPGTRSVRRTGPAHGEDSGASNYGIREVKILDGNIGYLDLRMFAGTDAAKGAIDTAMLALEGTDALIIDLGRNGGGGPWMVRYLSGFLFSKPTHLTDTWTRGMSEPRQRWTLDGQPTQAFHDKPVYLLTSKRTFSAAESFTFGLTINDRVIIVGEKTGGGGHFGDTVQVAEDLRLFVPRGRTYDPETGKGWEAAGIDPDLPTDYSGAVTRALDAAGKAIGRASIKAATRLNQLLQG